MKKLLNEWKKHLKEINDLQVVVENREQDIVNLISNRISKVGFGDENEEDFDYAKDELEDDGLASKQELEQITFKRWKELSGVNKNMGLPKPYPENKKASGDLERDVGEKISELLFGDPKNPEKILDPEKDIERIHAELEKAFTKDDLEFVFEFGTLDEVFDDEMYRKLKDLIM